MPKINPISPDFSVDLVSPLALDTKFRIEPQFSLPSSSQEFISAIKKPDLATPLSFSAPCKPLGLVVSRFLERLELFKEKYLQMIDHEISQIHDLSMLNLESHQKMELELGKAAIGNDYWDFLKQVGACLIGATSVVLGATLLAPGASALAILGGSSMILSGSASVLGGILGQTKTHTELASTLMLVGSGLGIVSGLSGAYLGVTTLALTTGRIISASLSIVEGGSSIMKNSYQLTLSDLKASDSTLRKSNEINKARFEAMSLDLKFFETESQRATENITVALAQFQASVKKITALSQTAGAA